MATQNELVDRYDAQKVSEALKILLRNADERTLTEVYSLLSNCKKGHVGECVWNDLSEYLTASRTEQESTLRLVIEGVLERYGREYPEG